MKKIIGLCLFALVAPVLSSCAIKSERVNNFVHTLSKNSSIETKVDSQTFTSEQDVIDAGLDPKDFTVVDNASGLGDEYKYCTYEKYTAEGAIDRLANYGQFNSILYPGAIVDISQPTLAAVNLRQSPITMSISLESVASNETYRPYVMYSPSLSESRKGVNELVNNTLNRHTNYPVRLSMDTNLVTNSLDYSIALGINVGLDGMGLGANMKYSTTHKNSTLVVTLAQIYYTIDIDKKYSASEYFSNKESEDRIINALDGTIPAVVSSVSYGRIAVCEISSDMSLSGLQTKIEAQLSTLTQAGVVQGDVMNEFKSALENNSLRTKILVYGGSLENGNSLGTSMSLDELIKTFSNSYCPDVAAAVPIYYNLRHIDDFGLAQIKIPNESVCYKVYHKRFANLDVTLQSIEVDWSPLSLDTSILDQIFDKLDGLSLKEIHIESKFMQKNGAEIIKSDLEAYNQKVTRSLTGQESLDFSFIGNISKIELPKTLFVMEIPIDMKTIVAPDQTELVFGNYDETASLNDCKLVFNLKDSGPTLPGTGTLRNFFKNAVSKIPGVGGVLDSITNFFDNIFTEENKFSGIQTKLDNILSSEGIEIPLFSNKTAKILLKFGTELRS